MSERARQVALTSDGLKWAVAGGAVAGAFCGIGAAAFTIGTIAGSHLLPGFVNVVVGLGFASAFGAVLGFVYGGVGGLVVGIVAAPVLAVWLTRRAVRDQSFTERTAGARKVAVVTTAAIAGIPPLWVLLDKSDLSNAGATAIPSALAVLYAPYWAERVVRGHSIPDRSGGDARLPA